jgi:hypothetical protein
VAITLIVYDAKNVTQINKYRIVYYIMVQVRFKKSIKLLQSEKALVNEICVQVKSQLKDIDLETMVNNLQMLQDIMLCLENLPVKKGEKIDKKSIVLKVYTILFPKMQTGDIEGIDQNIDFLCESGHIVKSTFWMSLLKILASFFLRG